MEASSLPEHKWREASFPFCTFSLWLAGKGSSSSDISLSLQYWRKSSWFPRSLLLLRWSPVCMKKFTMRREHSHITRKRPHCEFVFEVCLSLMSFMADDIFLHHLYDGSLVPVSMCGPFTYSFYCSCSEAQVGTAKDICSDIFNIWGWSLPWKIWHLPTLASASQIQQQQPGNNIIHVLWRNHRGISCMETIMINWRLFKDFTQGTHAKLWRNVASGVLQRWQMAVLNKNSVWLWKLHGLGWPHFIAFLKILWFLKCDFVLSSLWVGCVDCKKSPAEL